ncbi:flagellar biosynthetic protein FliR [Pseudoponticoccus marisrubri]|uniref:Flagellar biosynthesis protein FliR n=1 Tax=Pseudoponticoccus marisrubri TaxID=1685382 RepID=A0A0W7WG43_9RHOB|nr:flagellar biosynthetic protein FliR [Pseudoponticoccus marisrubri]KUF09596.1 flagellar biosynthesis protein FliR [Pseudoponticoccus marisrubri]
MTGLPALVDPLAGMAWAALLVFLRVAAAMFAIPGLGEQVISVRVRLVLVLMLTAIVAPGAPFLDTLPPFRRELFFLGLATETLSGLFLGLVLRFFIMAIQTAGSIAAQSTSLAQLMGQSGLDPLPAVGHILTTAALALLMSTGFHVKAAAFFVQTYQILPVLSFPNPADIAEAGRQRVSESFALAFSLAAPFVTLSVIYNLTLGVINKAMPQLMVAFVGAPVISFGAIAMLLVSAPVMLSAWLTAFERFLAVPFR